MSEAIKEALLKIKGNRELLPPVDVVERAKDPKHPLHPEFEWDDSVAGQAYRIWQARRLIAVHITNEQGQREMISLSVDRVLPQGGYRAIKDVVSNIELREVMLEDALRELKRIQAKYGNLRKLAGVWKEIQKAQFKFDSPVRSTARRGSVQSSAA